MSVKLDSRQRAILGELGLHAWSLLPALGRADASTADKALEPPVPIFAAQLPPSQPQTPVCVKAAPAAARPARTPVAQPGESILRDWDTLGQALQHCQSCAMGLGRRTPVFRAMADNLRADWMVVGDAPDAAQERLGQAFVEAPGVLLDRMLKALGVQRHSGASLASANASTLAYLTVTLKCRPALPTPVDGVALAQCARYLQSEIALVQPKIILAMGRLAMQVLLSQDHPHGIKLPLAQLRGQVWHYQGVAVVVTYPPDYLCRHVQDKARAWEDLCLARSLVPS